LSRLSKVLAPLPDQPIILPKGAQKPVVAAAVPVAAAPGLARDQVLDLLQSHPSGISCTEVSQATGLAYRTAFRHLDALVVKGKLKKSGAARATRYTLK
jgi:DNA-binding transcriptional ArsR family regulator